MSSYLAQWKNHQLTAKGFLAKSIGYLKTKLGISVSDEDVDRAVKATDELTDQLEALMKAYIAANLPAIPAVAATIAATAALQALDSAIAGAGNVIKDAN